MQQGATIAANATGKGNGGHVTVLSAGTTQMDGLITAKGGAFGGNGGFVEVSGVNLGMTGRVDVSAPSGAIGTILLDPDFLTIAAGLPSSGTQDPTFLTGLGTISASDPSLGGDTISNGVIDAFAGNVLLQANKTLTIAAPIALTTNPGQNLTLEAGGTVTVGTGIGVTASGDVIIATGGAGPNTPPAAQSGPLISILGSVTSTGGSVSLLSGPGGTVSIGAAGSVAAAFGGVATLQMDTLNIASGGKVSAPSGTIEIAPATSGNAITFSGTGAGTLTLPQATLNQLSASTLRLGAVTIGGTPTTTAGSISFDSNVNLGGIASTLDLETTGAVAATNNSVLTVGTLTGNSASLDLSTNGSTSIGTIGTYEATNAFSLVSTGSLAVTGPIGAADISLNADTINIADNLSAGTEVALGASAGGVTQATTSIINAPTLTSIGTITGGITLAGTANTIGSIGNFNFSGAATLADDTSPLTFNGTFGGSSATSASISAASATIAAAALLNAGTLAITTNTSGISLAGTITAADTLELVSAGKITQTSGSISTGFLTGSAITSASLTQPSNLIGTLGSFVSTAGFALTNNQALTINGPVSDTGAASTLALTTQNGGLTLGDNVNATNVLDLISSGTISQTSGTIGAGTLTGSAQSATLNLANAVASVGSFSATSGSFVLNDSGLAGSLTVSGPLRSLTNDVSITGAPTLSLTGSITANGTALLNIGAGGVSLAANSGLSGNIVDVTSAGTVGENAAATITAGYAAKQWQCHWQRQPAGHQQRGHQSRQLRGHYRQLRATGLGADGDRQRVGQRRNAALVAGSLNQHWRRRNAQGDLWGRGTADQLAG